MVSVVEETSLNKSVKTKNLVGPKIRSLRKERGWTQNMLAALLRKTGASITRDVIANIETQRCPVTDCQVVIFVKLFGVSLESLFLETTLNAPTNTPGKTHNPKNRSIPNAKGDFPQNSFARISRKIGKFAKRLIVGQFDF
jgi:transcriptional regulator with XRE-family HTH domain